MHSTHIGMHIYTHAQTHIYTHIHSCLICFASRIMHTSVSSFFLMGALWKGSGDIPSMRYTNPLPVSCQPIAHFTSCGSLNNSSLKESGQLSISQHASRVLAIFGNAPLGRHPTLVYLIGGVSFSLMFLHFPWGFQGA